MTNDEMLKLVNELEELATAVVVKAQSIRHQLLADAGTHIGDMPLVSPYLGEIVPDEFDEQPYYSPVVPHQRRRWWQKDRRD